MDYQPSNNPLPANIYFNLDWTVASGQPNADWPGFFLVGQGTPSGLPPGRRYWYTSSTAMTTYDVKLVNDSDTAIGYALALTGATFPPPALNAPGPGAPTSATTPAPTPTAAPPVGSPPPPAVPPASAPPPVATPVALNTATDRSGLILDPRVLVTGPFSTVQLRLDSSSATQVHIDRVVITPPPNAVVDGVTPNEATSENGVAWYVGKLVDKDDPLVGYEVRFWGSANDAVVEADWSMVNDKGTLTVRISGAPPVGPIGG